MNLIGWIFNFERTVRKTSFEVKGVVSLLE
jgi:hypothetical protein